MPFSTARIMAIFGFEAVGDCGAFRSEVNVVRSVTEAVTLTCMGMMAKLGEADSIGRKRKVCGVNRAATRGSRVRRLQNIGSLGWPITWLRISRRMAARWLESSRCRRRGRLRQGDSTGAFQSAIWLRVRDDDASPRGYYDSAIGLVLVTRCVMCQT